VAAPLQLPFASGEELHTVIARRYGAPVASVRDSLYDLMYDDAAAQRLLGATRETLLGDPVHPSAAGFKIYGDIVSYTVRETLAAVLASGSVDTAASSFSFTGYEGLPIPISPVAAQQDTDTWCREGTSFQSVASCMGSAGACKWKMLDWHDSCPHQNCRMRGYFLKGQGLLLRINLGASMWAASMHAGANSSSTGASSSSASTAGFERRYLAVKYMQGVNVPAERMGVAHVACIRGCSCKRLLLAHRAEANTGIAATEVRHMIRAVLMSDRVLEDSSLTQSPALCSIAGAGHGCWISSCSALLSWQGPSWHAQYTMTT
jgi:hypothetical protein